LVKSDGGRVREGQRDALLGKGGLLQVLYKLWQDLKICMSLSNSYLQALEDKEERLMLQYISSRGVSKYWRGQSGGLRVVHMEFKNLRWIWWNACIDQFGKIERYNRLVPNMGMQDGSKRVVRRLKMT
jgi:hypothetical protein